VAINKKEVVYHNYRPHTMDNDQPQKARTTTTSIAVIAIIAAVALLGVVVITVVVTISQQAEAKGCTNAGPGTTPTFGTAVNASKGRCIKS
jgi:flagellar basal body-associated protein FliL